MADAFISGAIAMAFVVAGLFFLRFWRDTGDRLFMIFALSFGLLAMIRVGLIVTGDAESNTQFYLYLLRLIAYVLILSAIIDKNWSFSRRSGQSSPPDQLSTPSQPA